MHLPVPKDKHAVYCAVLLTILLCCVGPAAHAADGNELFAVGAIQKSLGGAGVASPQDATWVLLNPASIVALESRTDLWLEMLHNNIESEVKGLPPADYPFVGKQRDQNWITIPSLALTRRYEHGAFGFGIFAIEGNRSDLPAPRTALGLLENADRRAKYEVVRFPFAYARRFQNGWALGGALIPTLTRFKTDSVSNQLHPTVGDFHWDYALGFGIQLGIYKRWHAWSLGASYTSRTAMQDYDSYRLDNVRANLDLPQKLQLGLAFRPREHIEIVLDYKWIDWSAIGFTGRSPETGGLGWHDQKIVRGGIQWQMNDRWTVRAGASYGKPPIDEETVLANALAPPVSKWHIGMGVGYQLNARNSLHFSYVHVPKETLVDSGRGGLFSAFGRGTRVGYREDSFTLQYSYAF